MPDVPQVSVEEAAERLEAGDAVFVDVRDRGSFLRARVPGALHVTDANVGRFVDEADKTRPVIVYCYHGISSLGGAGFFLRSGFASVASMSGGFTEWEAKALPHEGGAPEGDPTP